MKYIVLSTCFLMAATSGFAQKRDGIGLSFGVNDFYGPQTRNYFVDDVYTVSQKLDNTGEDTSKKTIFRWHPMVKFSYWRKVSRNFDVNLNLTLGNVDYPDASKDADYIARRKYGATKFVQFLGELDARVNYNIIPKEEYIIAPYLFSGISGSHRPNYFGATIPLGAGINFNLSRSHDLYLNLESVYKVAATNHDQNHLQHAVGFVYWFEPGYSKPKPIIADIMPAKSQPSDRDNDGIEDSQDQCPDIPGMAQFNGCPDSDGDGIGDKDDACPLVAGLAQFNGCPDTDGDGIPDNKDKCPYVAGTQEREGCPVPDRDNDGFTDDVDRCPDTYSKTNGGCPEIRKEVIMQVEKAAKAIFFETGKATIKPISFKSLDAVVSILKSDASLYADIEGHTDNVVPKTYTNMELSQKRAEAVRTYFISKGVSADRLTAQGFGDTQPVADNATAAGKAQNRRTVIKLRNYSK